jgi:hypothetical protein
MDSTDFVHRKEKVVAAFKGYVRNHSLVPSDEPRTDPDQEHDYLCRAVRKEGTVYDIQHKRNDEDRILSLVECLYPGMIDRKAVTRLLADALKTWVRCEHSTDDQQCLVQAAEQFLEQVEGRIQDYEIFIPLDGLEITEVEDVKIARCSLFSNRPGSDLRRRVLPKLQPGAYRIQMAGAIEGAPAFFKVRLCGQFERVTAEGREEAELSLNLLRLFIASYFYHEYRQVVPTRMGIRGILPEPACSTVFAAPALANPETSEIGFSQTGISHEPFRLDAARVDLMQSLGLDRINDHLLSLEGDEDRLAGSLMRSVTWFGKATNANSIAESFLMYALALEGLLGNGGRAVKENYALHVAALVTRDDPRGLYPAQGRVSPSFADMYNAARTTSDRFNAVRCRVIDLFSIRNSIAHGAKLERDIDGLDLLDFETLVRNSILSFVLGGWIDLGSFRDWVKNRVTYHFSP